MKSNPFCGTVAAVVTPFERDGTIDWFALDRVLGRAIDLGYDRLALFTRFGEGGSLSLDEKEKIAEEAALVTEHRAGVILTVSHPAEAEALCSCGRDASAAGVMFETPLFGRGIYSFLKKCGEFGLPMAVAREEGRGSMKVFPELFAIDEVAAIGETGKNFLETAELCDTVGKTVKGEVFCLDERLYPAMSALGACGTLSLSALFHDIGKAPSFRLADRLAAEDGTAYAKELLCSFGVCGETVRLPM